MVALVGFGGFNELRRLMAIFGDLLSKKET